MWHNDINANDDDDDYYCVNDDDDNDHDDDADDDDDYILKHQPLQMRRGRHLFMDLALSFSDGYSNYDDDSRWWWWWWLSSFIADENILTIIIHSIKTTLIIASNSLLKFQSRDLGRNELDFLFIRSILDPNLLPI